MKNRIASYDPSTYVLAQGGSRFGDSLKRQAFCLVSVKTDDASIPLGLLLRNDEDHQVRVGMYVSVMGDRYDFRRRGVWQVVAIPRNRIASMRALN